MVVPPSAQPLSQPAVAKKQRHPNGFILETWLQTHKRNLYPSREEKVQLGEEAQMSYNQVARWFANRRRKLKLRTSQSPADSSSSGGEKEETPYTPPSAHSPPWLPQEEQERAERKAGGEISLDSNNNSAEMKETCIPQQFQAPPLPTNPFAPLGLRILDPSIFPPYWWSMLRSFPPQEDQKEPLPPISFLHRPIQFLPPPADPNTQFPHFHGQLPISQPQTDLNSTHPPPRPEMDFGMKAKGTNICESRFLEKLSSMEERESIAISVLASFSQQVV